MLRSLFEVFNAVRFMAQGEILWFDGTRGYGFIRPDMGPKDVFMHVSALSEAGVQALQPGTKVEFELIQTGNGRLTAQRVFPVVDGLDRLERKAMERKQRSRRR